MNDHDFWEARVPDYTEDAFEQGHQYEKMIAGSLEFPIGDKDLQLLVFKRAVATWEQL